MILRGNLAPDGCVVKLAGHDVGTIRGPGARVRRRGGGVRGRAGRPHQGRATSSSSATKGRAADPGMREMLAVTGAIVGAGPRRLGRAPDRRPFSGATHGLMVGHVAPEAARGGPIAAVRDGDIDRLRRGGADARRRCDRQRRSRRGWRRWTRAAAALSRRRDGEVRAAGVVGVEGRSPGRARLGRSGRERL